MKIRAENTATKEKYSKSMKNEQKIEINELFHVTEDRNEVRK